MKFWFWFLIIGSGIGWATLLKYFIGCVVRLIIGIKKDMRIKHSKQQTSVLENEIQEVLNYLKEE